MARSLHPITLVRVPLRSSMLLKNPMDIPLNLPFRTTYWTIKAQFNSSWTRWPVRTYSFPTLDPIKCLKFGGKCVELWIDLILCPSISWTKITKISSGFPVRESIFMSLLNNPIILMELHLDVVSQELEENLCILNVSVLFWVISLKKEIFFVNSNNFCWTANCILLIVNYLVRFTNALVPFTIREVILVLFRSLSE